MMGAPMIPYPNLSKEDKRELKYVNAEIVGEVNKNIYHERQKALAIKHKTRDI